MKRRGNISYMLFLAVTAAVGGLLFGYDTAVISGTVELVTARFGLDSLQQGWYVGCALAGSIAGVLCSGVLSDRLGRRRTEPGPASGRAGNSSSVSWVSPHCFVRLSEWKVRVYSTSWGSLMATVSAMTAKG